MHDLSMAAVTLSSLLASYLVYRHFFNTRVSYPPGPAPKPFVGNALDIPTTKPWLKYMEMSKQYNSEIIYLSAFGTRLVILNSIEDTVELLERRSGNYSSRPSSPIFEMVGMDDILTFMPYGNSWRRQRKFMEKGLKKDSMLQFHDTQAEKVHLLLEQLLHEPAEFKEHCKTLGTSITMAMGFAYDIIPGRMDSNIELTEFAINKASELMLPGRTIITVFGFLRHIPPWVPWATTQKLGVQIKVAAEHYKKAPYETVRRKMASGTAKNSILKQVLEENTKEDGSIAYEEDVINGLAALYIGGVETMQLTQTVFIMAMALYPEVQRKAQEEVDRIIGFSRLPKFSDRPSLPYTEALYREVLRWLPATPLGFARMASDDDILNGYHIPKGSYIMWNTWAFSRDEEKYPEPESFRPQRYFEADGSLNDDNVNYTFGFGRRICPGKYMAENVVWLMVASVLATFSISKAKDKNGNEIDIDPNASGDGFTRVPLPFKCSIVPRSEQATLLISSAASIARQSLIAA